MHKLSLINLCIGYTLQTCALHIKVHWYLMRTDTCDANKGMYF